MEPPQPHKSIINKKIVIVFAVIVLLVFGLSAAFVALKKNIPQKTPVESKEAVKINISNLEKKGDVKNVVIAENGVTPSEVKLNRGQVVSFTNFTKKDLNINISGSSFNAGVQIKANSTMYSPIFNFGGTYSFTDIKDKTISGKILVSGSAGIAPDTSKFPVSAIHITKNGFEPSELKVTRNVLVRFLNETTNDAEITSSGPLLFGSGVIKPGLKWETSFLEPVSISYELKSNPSMKGVLIVE